MDRRAFDWFDLDPFDSRERPSRLVDQYFGTGLDADEFLVHPTPRFYSPRFGVRPARLHRPPSEKDGGVAERKLSKNLFSVKLDVHQFTPDEVTVKTKDNNLIIEAKHDEKEDPHGFISRHFTRRYVLPEDVKLDHMVCNLSSDGILAVEAPRNIPQTGEENVIPINQTGRPASVVTPTPSTPTAGSQAEAAPKTQNINIQREDSNNK